MIVPTIVTSPSAKPEKNFNQLKFLLLCLSIDPVTGMGFRSEYH